MIRSTEDSDLCGSRPDVVEAPISQSHLDKRATWVRVGGGTRLPTLVLFFGDQSPDDRPTQRFPSPFLHQPAVAGLSSVGALRNDDVLIARMSDLLAPISKSTTRT